jgi:hypothetical protein
VQNLVLAQTALLDYANRKGTSHAEPFYLPYPVLSFSSKLTRFQQMTPDPSASHFLGHTDPFLQTQFGLLGLSPKPTNPFLQTQIGLPGLKKDEVNINVEEGGRRAPLLHITAHHEQEEGDQSRFWEDVDTRIRLPEGTDPDQVVAEVG